ncbi:hypothetical protein BAE44_0015093 [Dichanthelium oligosanthes]|uniref:Proline-rich protein n=1 Tax=Dichanthelium oligosanthes TaxID=888268 RepID=A0A1E5VFH4_9POAL|nr:hypothetical protein BAE44_0015093 [Dichanthelium oligosanthes]
MLMAIVIANAASGEVASSVIVGLAKCADCTGKNMMKAETAFKGLKVAIKCKNSNGEYKSKAVGELQSSGAFSVPLSVDLDGADCLAQLHTAAGRPCPGQEPSRIMLLADGSFVAIPGNTQQPSAECASVTICDPIKKHFLDHFHKKPEPEPEPEPKPQPEYHPPTPTYGSPTPTYGSPSPINHHFFEHSNKGHDYHHFIDHFHKKFVPPEPKPQPEYNPPTPSYGTPTPIYHPPAKN